MTPVLNVAFSVELGERVQRAMMTDEDWGLMLDRVFATESATGLECRFCGETYTLTA